MIEGTVSAGKEAIIELTVKNSFGGSLTMAAVIDTGFTGWLTLPSDKIAALGWRWDQLSSGTLADGRDVTFDVYLGLVHWDGQDVEVLVQASDSIPLVGMALIEGYELNIRAVPGGRVTLNRL